MSPGPSSVSGSTSRATLLCAGLLLSAALLQGCGGGASTAVNEVASGGSTPVANHAPTISGAPTLQVIAGTAYSFVPQAADSDADALTFSVSNMPSWASFDKSTGRLSGMPSATNIGTFANILISANDGKTSTALAGFSIQVTALTTAGTATLSWMPPSARTDGSALNDLVGFAVRYGSSPDSFSTKIALDDPARTSYVIGELKSGTYYFVVTAIDSTGTESELSTIVSKTII